MLGRFKNGRSFMCNLLIMVTCSEIRNFSHSLASSSGRAFERAQTETAVRLSRDNVFALLIAF